MTAADLAIRLHAKPAGDGWSAKCPSHKDRKASLSIGAGADGRTLLMCHAGCGLDQILTATGLTTADLFAETTTTTPPHIITSYDYTDEFGTLLYQVCRFAPKDFRQRRPKPGGGWTWKLGDVRRVLYRLPHLRSVTVYIVEGERDADRLASLKLPATTNAGGAGKWRPEYTQQLKAASVEHIVILPDNDPPGRAHADQVARSCHAVGLQLKIVALPGLREKGDVSDWLDAGHTKAELIALVQQTPRHAPTIDAPSDMLPLTSMEDLLNEADETVDYLIDGMIQRGSVNAISAKPKVGKSTLVRELAVAVARGEEFIGRSCPTAGTVWYLAFEGRRQDIKTHFRRLGARATDPIHTFVGQAPKDVIVSVRARAIHERPDLIIIDTMQRFLKAKSTDDYAEMTLLFDTVIGIAQQSGAAMLLVTHSSKADRTGLDAILGSTAIAGSVDTAILLTRTARYRTIATMQRTGEDLDETILVLDESTGRLRLSGSRVLADQVFVVEQLAQALNTAGERLTQVQLFERVEARRTAKLAALKILLSGNYQVRRTGAGTKNDPYYYARVGSDSGSVVPLEGGTTILLPFLLRDPRRILHGMLVPGSRHRRNHLSSPRNRRNPHRRTPPRTPMQPTTDGLETVVLRGGVAVPLAALKTLWDLEARAFSILIVDGRLRVSPRSRLTAEDDQAIRRHRDELVALVNYCEAIQ